MIKGILKILKTCCQSNIVEAYATIASNADSIQSSKKDG